MQESLVEYYRENYPQALVVSRGSDGNFLNAMAKFHSFITLDGRRIKPSLKAERAPNSIIQMQLGEELFVGQVTSVLSHRQDGIEGAITFLQVRWFRPYRAIDTSPWDQL